MMKILWFSNTPCGSISRKDNGASGGWLIALESILKQIKDVELYVSFISNDEAEDFEFDGVHYYPIMFGERKHSNFVIRVLSRYQSQSKYDAKLLPYLLDVVKKVRPDLIHIHGTESSWGIVADYIHDIPIAYSIQGLIAPYTTKYWSGVPQSVIKRFDSIERRIRHISFIQSFNSFKIRAKREEHFLKNARYILGRTSWDRRCSLLCNSHRKYYQAEELMRPEFYEQEWVPPDKNNAFRIVSTISGTVSYKGFETALHAAALLKCFAEFDFEWIIVGYDSLNPMVKMSEYYKGQKASDNNIRFKGRIDAAELRDTLLLANVYCHVSHIENSPNSVCEALLLGMPTIVSFAGGTASLTKGDEREALLYQDGDPYALAGSIVDVHNNYYKAIEMGKRARQSALYRHNPKRVAESYVQIYRDIISDFARLKKLYR